MQDKVVSKIKYLFIFVLTIALAFNVIACNSSINYVNTTAETKDPYRTINVGIAWKCNDKPSVYESTISAVETIGANPVVLGQITISKLAYNADKTLTEAMISEDGELSLKAADIVKEKSYDSTNIGEVMKDIDCVIFLGGEDISPSLLATPTSIETYTDDDSSSYGSTINPTRDVSDYLLMSYCLDNNIPILGICRGMQMLAIVSGASLIQDISAFYMEQGITYNYSHRMQKNSEGNIPDYVAHDVDITDRDSIIYNIVLSDVIEDAPSWHHQAVDCDDIDNLIVTGVTTVDGITIDEVIERTDKTYALGVQFHPEAVVEKLNKQTNYTDYTDVNIMYGIFKSLVDAAR